MKLCNLFYILFNFFYISCDFNGVSAISTSDDTSTNETNDIVISYESECRALCESCDCNGFFCGDNECICECNANINVLNNYAECLKDIIKGNFYKYNISVQHLNVPSDDDKETKFSKNAGDSNKTIKKRNVVWEMQPEATNLEKEKIFMADATDFKLPPLNFDFVGSPFTGLKGLGDLNLPNLGIAKGPDVAAAVPAILAAPAKNLVAAPAPIVAAPTPVVAAHTPLVAAAAPVVAVPAPIVSASSAQVDTPVGSTADGVGMAALKAKTGIKAIEMKKLAGLLGKIKGIKLKTLSKGVLLGDAADGSVAAPAPTSMITQPAQTR